MHLPTTLFLLLISALSLTAQTTPAGLPVLDDYQRRQLLLGDTTVRASLLIRPSRGELAPHTGTDFRLMPLVWKQQYTTNHPLSLNDGPMIPARGYQTLLSAGLYARWGMLSLQLMPELVYAENREFDGFPTTHKREAWVAYNNLKGLIDLPDRFGDEPYRKAFWGQSALRMSYRSVSLGLSTENLWWGPGHKNSLLMSNNAPGFMHLTFNSTRPVSTPIGSFEWQLVAGRLDASGFPGVDTLELKNRGLKPRSKPQSWRYLNAITVNYQPRWLPGLSIGGARSYNIYSEDILWHNVKTWLPLYEPFLKEEAGGHGLDTIPSDQIASVWVRWLMPREHSEVYFEFGRGDHNWHFNDFLMEPAHDRAYILGYRKLVPLTDKRRSYLDVQLELTQFSRNVPTLLRPYNELSKWYTHGHVLHGYTNQGQILGAGIGTSSNMQLVNVAWINEKKRIGLELYRLNHDDDFWGYLKLNRMADYRTHWVDISGALVVDWDYRNLLFNFRFQTVGALNYMFLYDPVLTEPPYFWDYGKTRYNFNTALTIIYQFNR